MYVNDDNNNDVVVLVLVDLFLNFSFISLFSSVQQRRVDFKKYLIKIIKIIFKMEVNCVISINNFRK